MASKWASLKGKIPAFTLEPNYLAKVEEAKKVYVGLDTAELARLFGIIRKAKKSAEEIVSSHNIELEALSQLLVNDLEASSLQKVQLATGETVYISTEPYSSVQDRTKVLDWIKKKRLTNMLSVQWQTLNAFVKEQLVNGMPSPPGVAVYLKTSARLRGGNSNTGDE